MRLRSIHCKPPVSTAPSPPVLLAVTPPRTGERTLLGVENLLASIAVPEPFSLELAGDADGVTLMARCQDGQVIRGQLSAHYPQARIHEVAPEQDPLHLRDGEQAWSMTLRSAGPEYVPLRTFRDADLTDPGSDPLIALLGALSDLRDGERVVARLLLRSLGPGWAEHHQRLVHERPEPGAQPSYGPQPGAPQGGGLGMVVLGAGAFIALTAYQWVQAGRDVEGRAAGARRHGRSDRRGLGEGAILQASPSLRPPPDTREGLPHRLRRRGPGDCGPAARRPFRPRRGGPQPCGRRLPPLRQPCRSQLHRQGRSGPHPS